MAAQWPGSVLIIFEDVDEINPPSAEHCPMVQINPNNRTRDEGLQHVVMLLMVATVVPSEASAQVTGTNIMRRPSSRRKEELGRLVERTVTNALLGLGVPPNPVPPSPDAFWLLAGEGVFCAYNISLNDFI